MANKHVEALLGIFIYPTNRYALELPHYNRSATFGIAHLHPLYPPPPPIYWVPYFNRNGGHRTVILDLPQHCLFHWLCLVSAISCRHAASYGTIDYIDFLGIFSLVPFPKWVTEQWLLIVSIIKYCRHSQISALFISMTRAAQYELNRPTNRIRLFTH